MILVQRDLDIAEAQANVLRADGFAAHAIGCDLSSEFAVTEATSEIARLCGNTGLAALVNAAGGFAMSGNVADSATEVWTNQFSINLTTCYLTIRALLPHLRKARGAIVNFATSAAIGNTGHPGMSAYVAAKSGVVALTRAVAAEERVNGVRANAVAPTSIDTAVNIAAMKTGTKFVERERVAQTVLFLCSPAANAISGEVIRLT
jgi:NAD(P)-dependent dehydrogenase (short-subunit alcohol dehydrogenase family)